MEQLSQKADILYLCTEMSASPILLQTFESCWPQANLIYCNNLFEFFKRVELDMPRVAMMEVSMMGSRELFATFIEDVRKRQGNRDTKFIVVGVDDISTCFAHGCDYFLPSPPDATVLTQILQRLGDVSFAPRTDSSSPRQTLVINTNDCTHIIRIPDLVMIRSKDLYTHFVMANSQTIVSSRNLGFYEKELADQPRLLRVHKNTILNLDYVKGINNKTEKLILLKAPFEPIKASRYRFKTLIERLQQV